MADALGITESHLSNIAAGRKSASVDLLQRISDHTRIPVGDLIGAPGSPFGLHEDAAPFDRSDTQSVQNLVKALAPECRHALAWTAMIDAPQFSICSGDLLVVDMSVSAPSGSIALASTPDGDSAVTRIFRRAGRVLVPPGPADDLVDLDTCFSTHPIIAVARGQFMA